METPYLPDIMEGVVARVSAITQTLSDPFETFFDKGIYSAVTKNIYSNNSNSFPLVWLVMPYRIGRGNYHLHGEANCGMILAMPTEADYTQEQRDELTFKPRLLPIYEFLIQEIANEPWFALQNAEFPLHDYEIRPYWGGGEGTNNPNLFQKEIDAISISNLKLPIRRENCNTPAFFKSYTA